MKKEWFSVDKEGLKALQKGKSKTFIINELCQNAFDEDIKECKIDIYLKKGKIYLSVSDDSPTGFRDITHAYTLFADTYKRRDPTKRGRFNIGEKQVIAICDYAKVTTTKGTVIFDDKGRTETNKKTKRGSIIEVVFDGTEDDLSEILGHCKKLLPPQGIKFVVNSNRIKCKPIYKTFESKLHTQILKYNEMQWTLRKTSVNVIAHNGAQSYLYEMGIPIMPVDIPWHVDVQQKIPLNTDRTTVRPAFVKDICAEVLNVTYDDITDEQSSEVWIRRASNDDRMSKDAMNSVLTKRFGDKFVSRNPNDTVANDDAISKGYKVVSGSEMSKGEWSKAKEFGLVQSSSDVFGKQNIKVASPVETTDAMDRWARFCKKCAKEFQGNDIEVLFVSCKGVKAAADYGGRTLRYNLALLGKKFFDGMTKQKIDLLIHEIAHEKGNHTQDRYHKEITRLAGAFTMKALKEPKFFMLT